MSKVGFTSNGALFISGRIVGIPGDQKRRLELLEEIVEVLSVEIETLQEKRDDDGTTA